MPLLPALAMLLQAIVTPRPSADNSATSAASSMLEPVTSPWTAASLMPWPPDPTTAQSAMHMPVASKWTRPR